MDGRVKPVHDGGGVFRLHAKRQSDKEPTTMKKRTVSGAYTFEIPSSAPKPSSERVPVVAGLVPAIHAGPMAIQPADKRLRRMKRSRVDGRVKPVHDGADVVPLHVKRQGNKGPMTKRKIGPFPAPKALKSHPRRQSRQTGPTPRTCCSSGTPSAAGGRLRRGCRSIPSGRPWRR